MTLRSHPRAVAALVFTFATLVSLGPHLMILGYQVAGATPPAGLLLLCPLHRLEAERAPALVLHARPLT
ncbi:MAG TPA: hypothetical protein VIK04_07790 [Solirubrobacteraceae bacterium]